jgi:hypothetical protein
MISTRIKWSWHAKEWITGKCVKPGSEEKAAADAEIEAYQQRQWKAYHTSTKEFARV